MEDQADGSKHFTDYDNQFQVNLPEGWIILPLSSKDLADILESAAEENPELKDTAALLKDLDPDVIRVMAFNKNHKYNINGFTTNLVMMAVNDQVMTTMPMDFVMGMLVESVKQQGGVLLSTDNNVQPMPTMWKLEVLNLNEQCLQHWEPMSWFESMRSYSGPRID